MPKTYKKLSLTGSKKVGGGNESPCRAINNNDSADMFDSSTKLCSTPPTSSYMNRNFDEFDSPPITMSQVDKCFGVTWAEEGEDSGFSSTPKHKTHVSRTHHNTSRTPHATSRTPHNTSRTPLAIKKLNTPKQMPLALRKRDTTKGFYKFMENTKHLTSFGRSLSNTTTVSIESDDNKQSHDDDPNELHIYRVTTNSQNTNNVNINIQSVVPIEESIILLNRLDQQQTPTKTLEKCKIDTPPKSIQVSNLLSTSIQNDFFNDSDFDKELYQCSQQVEETLISQSQPEYSFTDEYDSFDTVINYIDIDKLVAKEKGKNMIRHHSMPTYKSVKMDRNLLGPCIEVNSSPSSSTSSSPPSTEFFSAKTTSN